MLHEQKVKAMTQGKISSRENE